MLRYILAQNGAGAAFAYRTWNHAGKGINGGDWAKSGQMPGRCEIVQRNGGKGIAKACENKNFPKTWGAGGKRPVR